MTTQKATKALQSSRLVYPELKKYFQESWQAKQDKTRKVVWMAGYFYPEIFHAFDMLPIAVDNIGATFGAKQLAATLCEWAEAKGYHRHICAYCKNALGYLTDGPKHPEIVSVLNVPPPDLVVGGLYTCNTHPHLAREYARILKVPLFIFDLPVIHPRMDRHQPYDPHPWAAHSYYGCDYKHIIEPHYLDYCMRQNKNLISFLEHHSGKKFDLGKFKEILALSDRASALVEEVQDYRKAVPCPAGAVDMYPFLTPMFLWKGTERCVELLEKLAEEVREKVKKKEGAIPNERYRLVVQEIPPWYSLGIYDYLAQRGAISCMEAYTVMFALRYDPDYPLESLAYAQLSFHDNYSTPDKLQN